MNHPEYAPGSAEAVKRDDARQQKAQRRQELREEIQQALEDADVYASRNHSKVAREEIRLAQELFAEYVEVE
ncbi:MAG: hypothetical protein ACYTEQ_30930 [Planctomycetota bacterium]|jgi:hypothetical protein